MVRVRGPLACFSLSESGDYITLHYINRMPQMRKSCGAANQQGTLAGTDVRLARMWLRRTLSRPPPGSAIASPTPPVHKRVADMADAANKRERPEDDAAEDPEAKRQDTAEAPAEAPAPEPAASDGACFCADPVLRRAGVALRARAEAPPVAFRPSPTHRPVPPLAPRHPCPRAATSHSARAHAVRTFRRRGRGCTGRRVDAADDDSRARRRRV